MADLKSQTGNSQPDRSQPGTAPTDSRQTSLSPPAWYFCKSVIKFFFSPALRESNNHLPPAGHTVPADFSGVCVATSADPACDAYVIERLTELGITHVRLDYSYDSPGEHGSRLLEGLLGNNFKVMLHLVQPLEEAKRMKHIETQLRWRQFVADTLDDWGAQVEIIEIGSTVNRRRWAGYTLPGFTACWTIAFLEAKQRNLRISGPNISDFEPLYTIALLDLLYDSQQLPQYYTNNLFVERVIQPEVYDHRIYGVLLAPLVRYNLIRKARQLKQIAERKGIDGMICSYVSWTLPRIKRFTPEATAKQADYLTRYLVLAAASGAFKRVYWGALINCREGLIDDAHAECPNNEIVTYYNEISGNSALYRKRAAFFALQAFQAIIPGSDYLGARCRKEGLEIHEFVRDNQRVHVVWSLNSTAASFVDLYPDGTLQQAEWIDRDGRPLPEIPSLVKESPVYLRWPISTNVTVKPDPELISGLAICTTVSGNYYSFHDDNWQGLVLADNKEDADKLFAVLHPDKINEQSRTGSLRNARNAIWTIDDPRSESELLVVKQPVRLSWNKKLTERFKHSKAQRSWNGACELLRRGIATPMPVAYFDNRNEVDLLRNWYVCELEENNVSARHFMTEFSAGATEAYGIGMQSFLHQLCEFVLNLHQRGVFFRDLSGGNVLTQQVADGLLTFSLIDTARARFYHEPLVIKDRLADLVRLLHKLHWEGREIFLEQYFAAIDKPLKPIHKLHFRLYDFKAGLKRAQKKRKKK